MGSKSQKTGNGNGSTVLDAEATNRLLRDYVCKALQGTGTHEGSVLYANFLKELGDLKRKLEAAPSEADETSLCLLVRAVTANVSALRERLHDGFLAELFSIRLWSCPQSVRTALLELLTNVIVGNAAFINTCLQVLVYSLIPPPTPPAPGQAKPEADGGPWVPAPEALETQAAIIAALDKALRLVPTLPSALLPMLTSQIPHRLRDRDSQCLYLRGLFAIAEMPSGISMREALLTAAMEHVMQIDVEIKWEEIVDVPTGQEGEEGDTEEEQEDIFELEGVSRLDLEAAAALEHHTGQSAVGWEGGKQAAAAAAAANAPASGDAAARPPVDEAANKLDSLMELIFEHLEKRIAAGQLGPCWQTALSFFERTLLHAHRSKFTQFLIFYLAAQDPERCSASYVQCLVNRMTRPEEAAISRSAAAAYVASFLARAAFCPDGLVVHVLQHLADVCSDYTRSAAARAAVAQAAAACAPITISSQANGTASAAAAPQDGSMTERHQVFYAQVQALLYILCYHLEPLARGLRGAPGAAAAVRGLVTRQVLPLLSHPLAPATVCLPTVTAEFAAQAAALKLADTSGLLPDESQRSQRPLEMFFPFDPYLLKRSSHFLKLKTSYVRWRRGHPTVAVPAGGEGSEEGSDEGSDSMDEDEMAEEFSSDDGSTSTSSSSDDASDSDDDVAGSSPLSADGMAISLPNSGHGAMKAAAAHRARFAYRPRPVSQAARMAAASLGAGASFSPSTLGDGTMDGSLGLSGSPYGSSPTMGGSPMSYTPGHAFGRF